MNEGSSKKSASPHPKIAIHFSAETFPPDVNPIKNNVHNNITKDDKTLEISTNFEEKHPFELTSKYLNNRMQKQKKSKIPDTINEIRLNSRKLSYHVGVNIEKSISFVIEYIIIYDATMRAIPKAEKAADVNNILFLLLPNFLVIIVSRMQRTNVNITIR